VDIPSGEEIVRWLLPLDDYKAIRDDMVDIYVAAYYEYPPATEAFSKLSIPELQDRAGRNAVAALNYDPTAAVGQIQQMMNRLLRWIAVILVSIFLVGVGTGTTSLVALSREGIQLLSTVSGVLLTAVASGSTIVGAFAGFVFLYVWLLSASSTVIGVLNEELIYGPIHFKTRAHGRLVGYTVWNSSLDGSGAIKLLLIFSSLKVLSTVPGWNPYRSIKLKVQKNIDLFGNADGFIDATKMAFRRMWSKRQNQRGEAREVTVSNEPRSRGR
jgi:hypothetical protein